MADIASINIDDISTALVTCSFMITIKLFLLFASGRHVISPIVLKNNSPECLCSLRLAYDFLWDCDDMEEMLDEFLAFSRGDSLETAQRSLVGALFRRVAENTKRLDQSVELITDSLPHPDLTLTIREAAMTRALENLVTNALRYGSRARLSMEVSPKEVAFVIEDDGPGIALSDRENAKRPFVRLVEARNQNLGTGVGLGLAIATDIASSHGGALDLEDSTDLGGLRAVLRLPR